MSSLPDLWAELEAQQRPATSDVRLKLAHSSGAVRIFAALTEQERLPALLLELPEAVKPRSFPRILTRAFEVSTPTFVGLSVQHWAVVIDLKDRAFLDLFQLLAEEVVSAALGAGHVHEVLPAVGRCLERWRRFLERRAGPLSDEEVRGLIGEIVVLCRCSRHLDARTALTSWTGPDAAMKDFELPDASVEVKTFAGHDSATVVISRPDQLDSVAERPLYLCAVGLTQSDAKGATLAEFAAQAANIVGGDPANRDLFESRLASAGFVASHASWYPKRFLAGPVAMYSVGTTGFPRIRSTDIPAGVLDVRFRVSLSALGSFKTDPVPLIGGLAAEVERSE